MKERVIKILKEEKGNVEFVFVLLMFMLIGLYMMLGGMETNISVMTVNEIKDILQTVTPYAIRKGINKDAHKNETLLYRYDEDPIKLPNDTRLYNVKSLFIKKVLDSLEDATFKSRIVYDRSVLESKLQEYTTIKTGSERWVNSWSKLNDENERKKVDFVILSTVLPIEIKSVITTSSVSTIQDQFNRTNELGKIEEGDIKVSFDLTQNGIGAFIRFEMRVVLK